MPSHKLHIKWEKKLGLPSDKKMHEIVDDLAHHDARGIKTINPYTPYWPFIKDLPKRLAERYSIIVSGLHSIFEELKISHNISEKDHYDFDEKLKYAVRILPTNHA